MWLYKAVTSPLSKQVYNIQLTIYNIYNAFLIKLSSANHFLIFYQQPYEA